VGEGELGAGLQPAREVVPLGVVDDRLLGDGAQALLQLPQVRSPLHLLAVGVPEHEVPEAEVVEHHPAQVLEQERRALQEKIGAHAPREGLVLGAGGVQDDRDVGVGGADVAREVEPRLGRPAALPGELDVGDDPQHLLLVGPEGGGRLLEGGAEEDLGPGAPAQDLLGPSARTAPPPLPG